MSKPVKAKLEDLKVAWCPEGYDPQGPCPFGFKHRMDPVKAEGIKNADVLLLWGGTDIFPGFYGQKAHPNNQVKGYLVPTLRDKLEWYLIQEAYTKGIPIIGVCRGAQLLCAFSGGSLYQDVTGHKRNHTVTLKDGVTINMAGDHHQMMDLSKCTHDLLGWSTNKLSSVYDKEEVRYFTDPGKEVEPPPEKEPEIVSFYHTKSLAIQGHPEWMMGVEFTNDLPVIQKLVRNFLNVE